MKGGAVLSKSIVDLLKCSISIRASMPARSWLTSLMFTSPPMAVPNRKSRSIRR